LLLMVVSRRVTRNPACYLVLFGQQAREVYM
jgi:hypothetical protein